LKFFYFLWKEIISGQRSDLDTGLLRLSDAQSTTPGRYQHQRWRSVSQTASKTRQAHAGWTLIRSRYDDGGYSGGSTDRPDLQLRDPPTEWSRQFEALGLNPE
jgi:hypothetical protein